MTDLICDLEFAAGIVGLFDGDRMGVTAMALLVFVIAAMSAAIGYMASGMLQHRRIAAEREANRLINQMERDELTDFMQHVQSVASNVDEKVDLHSSNLATINEDLGGKKQPDPKLVLRAVKQLYEANQQLHGELTSAQQQIEDKQRKLESYMTEARTDQLTGISNRRAFDEEIYRLFALRQRRNGDLCLMIADIDHFKLFNDYHGHQVGDEMLQRVAARFEDSTRSSDIVCRYGGEEFAILLPRTKLADAVRVAERTRATVEALKFALSDCQLHVTVSVGVVQLQANETINEFVKRADAALYSAKLAGRNCVWDKSTSVANEDDHRMAAVAAPGIASGKPSIDAGAHRVASQRA